MKDNVKTRSNSMGTPPYKDANPPRMKRTVGSGKGGSTWSIPNGAKYGLGEGKQPTRMDRSPSKGKSGNTFSAPCNGPAKSSRKDTGANTSQPKSYGTGGVSGGASGGYGGS